MDNHPKLIPVTPFYHVSGTVYLIDQSDVLHFLNMRNRLHGQKCTFEFISQNERFKLPDLENIC